MPGTIPFFALLRSSWCPSTFHEHRGGRAARLAEPPDSARSRYHTSVPGAGASLDARRSRNGTVGLGGHGGGSVTIYL